MIHFLSGFCFFLFSFTLMAQTGLEISLSGDLVFDQGLSSDSNAKEKLTIRSAEMTLYAPIDHHWDGNISFAAHDEAGQTMLEVHELFFSSTRLIEGLRLKIGQYFLGIGRLNRFHQHDWAFTQAPKVHREFLDEEAVFDTGVEVSSVLPTDFYLDLTVGVTSGYKFGHVHSEGQKPKMPTHYARLASFYDLGRASGVEYGVSYLGRKDANAERYQLVGTDLVFKRKMGRVTRWYSQSEVWYRMTDRKNGVDERDIGFYSFLNFGFSQIWEIGFRVDGLKQLEKKNILGNKVNNIHYGFSPQLTYRSSEFFYSRLTFSHEFEREEGITQERDTQVMLQFVFILGAHPAHDF